MKSARCLAFVIFFFLIMGFISTARAAYPQTITTTSPWINLPRPDDDPRWAKAFVHWDKRADTEQVDAALALVEQIAGEKPESYEARLWLCRINYLMAMRYRKERDGYCKKSIAAADQALKIKPDDDLAKYWRLSSIVLLRELSEEEYQQVHSLGLKYRHVRPLPALDDDPLWSKALAKYDERMDPENARAAVKDFEKLDSKYPERIEPKLFLSLLYYSLGENEPDNDAASKLYGEGAEWGRKAILIEPRNPAANYCFSITMGRHCERKGMFAMVRHSIAMSKAVVVVVEEEPTYMYGGFSRYIAASLATAGELSFRVCEMLGFPQELIIRVSRFATRMEPACIDNHIQLAKMYITLGKMDEAEKSLETAINTDPATLMYYEAQNRIDQKEARKLYDEHYK